MLLGAIADDFTGATDLCSMLVRGGMRTVQLIGVPGPNDPPPDADAVVVALKSRTIAPADARRRAYSSGGRPVRVLANIRQWGRISPSSSRNSSKRAAWARED